MLKHATETPIRSRATQNPAGSFPQCVARSGLEYQRQKPISHSQHQGAGPLGCAYEICAYLPLTSPGPMGFSYGARHLETIGLNDSTRGAQHKSSNSLSQSPATTRRLGQTHRAGRITTDSPFSGDGHGASDRAGPKRCRRGSLSTPSVRRRTRRGSPRAPLRRTRKARRGSGTTAAALTTRRPAAHASISNRRSVRRDSRLRDSRFCASAARTPGPGACRGLNRLHGRRLTSKSKASPPVGETQELLRESQRPGRLGAHMRPLEMRDVEHSLCELDKLLRVQMARASRALDTDRHGTQIGANSRRQIR